MAKNLALLALLLGIASLFLPLSQLGGLTKGVFTGTIKEPIGAMFMAPSAFASLFGATLGRRRFGRGLGALHLLFGLAGFGLCAMLFADEDVGKSVELGTGIYCATAAGLLTVVAGLIGLVKPDPKV